MKTFGFLYKILRFYNLVYAYFTENWVLGILHYFLLLSTYFDLISISGNSWCKPQSAVINFMNDNTKQRYRGLL